MGLLDYAKKIGKKIKIERNRQRGSTGEEIYRTNRALKGYEVKRTGKGSDYKERKINLFTGKKSGWTHVEVKTGNAKLSPLQCKTKKSVKRYKVFRI